MESTDSGSAPAPAVVVPEERAEPPPAAVRVKVSPSSSPAKPFQLGAFEATLRQAEEFETYQLKNGTQGSQRVRLSTMVYRHQPSNRQSSIQHLRLLAEANMLVVDTWSIRTIMDARLFMILDDGCLHRVVYGASKNTISEVQKVMTLYPPRRARSLPPSLHFISSTCAVVCDGGRVLTIYETDNSRTTWESFFEYRIIGPQAPGTKPGCDRPPPGFDFGFYIVDARLTIPKQEISILLRGVRDFDDKPSENFVRWITVEIADPKKHSWTLKRTKSIVCPGELEFIGFDCSCDHLVVVSDKPPLVEEEEKVNSNSYDPSLVQVLRERDNDRRENQILYVWYQTEEHVKVYCRLEQENSYLLKASDISFVATEGRLKIMARDKVVLEGDLGGLIDTEETEWELRKPMEGMRRVEFTLKKKERAGNLSSKQQQQQQQPGPWEETGGNGMWMEVVKGDGRGKWVDDPEDVGWSMQALDVEFVDNEMPIRYFTSSKDSVGLSHTEKMEECDMDDAERFLYYLNENTNAIDHICDLRGRQVLFATKAFPPLCQTRALCLREGEHGYIYNFEIFPPRHIQILKAFGHVQMGKPYRRYSYVSPHGGYGVVVDRSETAYAYWQSNGQTGDLDQYKEVTQRAYDPADNRLPMQVVNMRAHEDDEEVDDEIMGFVATEDTLVLLSADTLVFHRLRVPPVKWARSAAESNLATN